MMPSTSVQIHSSAASSAAARIDAEKSEPPRPSVVGRPSAVAPLKPVTTGSTPCSQQRQQTLARLLAGRLHQRRRVAEHRVGDDHIRGVHRLGRRALRRSDTRQSAAPRAARRWPRLHPPSAAAARPASACRSTMRSNSPISSRDSGQHGGLLPSAGSSSRQASSWRSRKLVEIGVQPGVIAGLGVAHGVEQQVGDLRHRRDHDHHRPLASVARRPDRGRHAHALGASPRWCRRIS